MRVRWQQLPKKATATVFIKSSSLLLTMTLMMLSLTSLITPTEQLTTPMTTTTTKTTATSTTTTTTSILTRTTSKSTSTLVTTPTVAKSMPTTAGQHADAMTSSPTMTTKTEASTKFNNRYALDTVDFYKQMNASIYRQYTAAGGGGGGVGGGSASGAGINVNLSINNTGYDWDDDMSSCVNGQNVIVKLITMILYAVVCIVGLFGNTLVIYVVLRFSKMQTVTNIYILNLAIADECFLIGIPFLLYTMQIGNWTFGEYMCKAYMVSTSITQFTSSIFLLIMSADRYIAVCHPISSPRFRTPFVSKVVSAIAWMTSVLLMLPVILFANTVPQGEHHYTCNIEWPDALNTQSDTTFILYTLALGFATPLTFILVFYCLVIRKLHTVGPKNKSKEKKRSHRKVTKLVLTVITVYIMCWLPYWISQVALINSSPSKCASRLEVAVFLLCGCLSYSNSAMNPVLYAFLSDNFKKSFMKACTCAARKDVNAQLQLENSFFPKFGKNRQSDRLIGGGGGGAKARQRKALVASNNNAAHAMTTTTTTTTTTGGLGNTATTYADGVTCTLPVMQITHGMRVDGGGIGGVGGELLAPPGIGTSATLMVVSTETKPLEHSGSTEIGNGAIVSTQSNAPVLHTDL